MIVIPLEFHCSNEIPTELPKKKNPFGIMTAILIGLGFLLLTGSAIALFGAVVINKAIAESKDLDPK